MCRPRAGAALAARRAPEGLVFTRGTPPRNEGCRPASRGLMLALMTWAQSRKGKMRVNSFVTKDVNPLVPAAPGRPFGTSHQG